MFDLLHEGIAHFARRTPDKEAFRFLKESITYKELDAKTGKLAAQLIDKGVNPGDRVGVYLHKSLESAISIFGIMKAGAAYVPLDPAAPTARTSKLMEMCGIRALVTHDKKRAHIQEILNNGAELDVVVGLTDFENTSVHSVSWEQIDELEAVEPISIQPDALAYIMYTSGSTGAPKGITHTHASGMASARMMADLFEVTCDDRLGNHAPLHFDISTFDYFAAPLRGATCVIVAEPYTKLPASLVDLVEKERLTTWYSVPHALLQMLQVKGIQERNFSSLRHIMFGGEPLHPAPLRQLMEVFPDALFTNYYGPAETNGCAYYHVPRPLPADLKIVPIGDMCPNAEGLILSDEDKAVKDGDTGELLVHAPTMMESYWDAPELNAKCFFHQDNADGRSKRFYRTGDLVTRPQDQPMVFLGRKDRQIKLRGFRIELDEVEFALSTHENVAEAGAFLRRSGASIEAAVRLKQANLCEEKDLLMHIRNYLPHYAVPSKVHIVVDFPRTGSDKIDRTALRDQFEPND